MPTYTRPPDTPEHCAECGAHLSSAYYQDLHKEWHAALIQTITIIAHTAEAAAAMNQPLA